MDVPLRLLIIEDSDDDAALVVRELKRAGYEVAFKRVDTPEMLNSAIAGQDWDLAISAFSMPQFSGTDALKLVRSMGCEDPFIFFSGTTAQAPPSAPRQTGTHTDS